MSRTALVCSLLAVLAWSSPVHAAPEASSVRYRRPSAKVKPTSTIKTTVDRAKARASKEDRKQPTVTAVEIAMQKVAVEQEIALAQEKKLRQLIDLTDVGEKDYPKHLFRLADLYLGMKAYHDLQAGELEEKIYAAKEKGDATTAKQLEAKQKRHRAKSTEAAKKAVREYHKLVTSPKFKTYDRLDEALYYYAFELGQLGREADMQDAYVRLVHEFPQSKYTANAYVTFGDFKFAQGDIPNAIKLYTRVVEGYKDSPVYAYALYKLGWCHLNPSGTGAADYPKSLDMFVATIKATLEGRAGSDENGKMLRRDARRDLVRAYVHAGKPSTAWGFFGKVGGKMQRSMMEGLAGAYFGEGKYVESSATYKKLQEEFSSDPDICEWQYRIVVNALATDDPGIQWKETQRLSETWVAAKDAKWKKADVKRCRDHTRDTLRQMATVWHDEADKTRKEETYTRSELAYVEYLRHFPRGKEAYDMAYYHAEVLWQQAELFYERKAKADKEKGKLKFREAADAFAQVLESSPKGKWAKDAAYASMLGVRNFLEYDESMVKTAVCRVQTDGTCPDRGKQDYKPTPFSREEEEMLVAYERYETFIDDDKDPELPKIMFHRARLNMEHNRFDDAIPTAQGLVEKFDGSIYAVWGAEMLIDALTIKWQEDDKSATLKRWARKIEKTKSFKHDEAVRIRKQVPLLLAAIDWKEAEALCKRGQETGDVEAFVAGGRKFIQIYETYDAHDRADEVLFNGARCLEAGYLLGAAISAREELLRRFPESKLAKQTLKEVGQNFQRIAYYDRAATRFESYAEKYAKDDFSAEALHNAFLFRLGLGEDDKAENDLDRYEKMYRRQDPGRAAGIFWARLDLAETEDQKLERANDYIATYGKKGGADRLAVAHSIAGQILWRRSCTHKLLHDVCITVDRKRSQAGDKKRRKAEELRRRGIPTHCGDNRRALIKVHARDPKLVAAANKHLSTAISLGKKGSAPKDDAARAEAFRDAVGLAMVYRADERYEEYLGVDMPENLDFGYEHLWKKGTGIPKLERQYEAAMKRKADTEARFQAFFDKKKELRLELLKSYAEVKETKSKHWMLAAAARSASLNQNFADQLYRAPVPKNIRTQEQYDAYCDEIGDFAAGPEKAARDAFAYCLERSTQLQFFNEFSRLCEDEMQQRDADAYPATNELFGGSQYTESRMDRVGVQTVLGSVKSP